MIHALHESASREAVVNRCVVLHTPQRALNHLRLSPCGFIFMPCGERWTKGRDVGSPLYLALELHFWYYYWDFLINVRHKKEKSGQSALLFLETSSIHGLSSGSGRAVFIHCCKLAKQTISLLVPFCIYTQLPLVTCVTSRVQRYKCLPGETCLSIFAQLFPVYKELSRLQPLCCCWLFTQPSSIGALRWRYQLTPGFVSWYLTTIRNLQNIPTCLL